MKVEITTLELAELLNTVQGRHKVTQNPLGMSAEELIEKVSDRVTEKIVAAIEANAAEEPDDDEALADRILDRISELVEETKKAAAPKEPVVLDYSTLKPLPAGFALPPAEDTTEEHEAAGEQPDVVTLGDLYQSERAADPDYPNKLAAPPKEPEAPEDEAPKEVISMPVWDESAGVYVVRGSGYIGRDLWKKEPYYEFFNSEIRQLLKDGKSPRYIADRLKVRERSVMERIRDAKID